MANPLQDSEFVVGVVDQDSHNQPLFPLETRGGARLGTAVLAVIVVILSLLAARAYIDEAINEQASYQSQE